MHCFIILVNLCAHSDTCFCFSVKQKEKTTIQILFILNNAASMATANRTCEKAKMSNHPGKQTLIVETSLTFYVAFM